MKKLNLAALALFSITAVAATRTASADSTITFSGATNDSQLLLEGQFTEAGFNYSAITGGINAFSDGNHGVALEGREFYNGGILSIASSVAHSLFTLKQLDIGAASFSIYSPFEITGYRNGQMVASDSYTVCPVLTCNGGYNWSTVSTINLAGKNIDQLYIDLKADNTIFSNSFGSEQLVDNVVLGPATQSPVPEPSTFTLLGTGVLSLAAAARRKLSRS